MSYRHRTKGEKTIDLYHTASDMAAEQETCDHPTVAAHGHAFHLFEPLNQDSDRPMWLALDRLPFQSVRLLRTLAADHEAQAASARQRFSRGSRLRSELSARPRKDRPLTPASRRAGLQPEWKMSVAGNGWRTVCGWHTCNTCVNSTSAGRTSQVKRRRVQFGAPAVHGDSTRRIVDGSYIFLPEVSGRL